MGEAAAHYAKALETRPDDVSLLNRAAWILATASDAGARNGARARAFADRAVQITSRQDAASLDSLAASLAELGKFVEARRVIEEALSVAGSKGDSSLLRELESRAAHYARNEPFRDR
jgi:Flp pilus assembly protein TadD